MIAGMHVKEEGKDNDLLKLLAEDDELGKKFGLSEEDLKKNLRLENYIGLADVQVDAFLKEHVDPVLEGYGDLKDVKADINV